MRKIKVRTVGVSILGGNAQVEGRFELGIDSIRAVNEVCLSFAPRHRHGLYHAIS
jgi:NADH dehydrogenase [ubiquinone] 1 alpha subcomplex assembly factor 1